MRGLDDYNKQTEATRKRAREATKKMALKAFEKTTELTKVAWTQASKKAKEVKESESTKAFLASVQKAGKDKAGQAAETLKAAKQGIPSDIVSKATRLAGEGWKQTEGVRSIASKKLVESGTKAVQEGWRKSEDVRHNVKETAVKTTRTAAGTTAEAMKEGWKRTAGTRDNLLGGAKRLQRRVAVFALLGLFAYGAGSHLPGAVAKYLATRQNHADAVQGGKADSESPQRALDELRRREQHTDLTSNQRQDLKARKKELKKIIAEHNSM